MEERETRCSRARLGLLVGFLCLCGSITGVGGSIHEYRNEAFARRSNALFFHGGSEGLHASKSHGSRSDSSDKPLHGKSFIR